MHILVVDDDVQLAKLVSSALIEAGRDTIFVHNGERALDKAKETPFDLVVLDIILPEMDGFDVLRHLRSQHMASSVLMLTTRDEVKERLTGLQLGADDCLPKPFAMRELVARVNALGRRYSAEPGLNLPVSDLTLDVVNHQVHRGSRQIELSARELMLLKVLMREPGRVFTRELELAAQLYFPGGRYLTVLIFFVAWSASSGVINTVVRDCTAPLALTANERAAASTLLGRSAMTRKSSLPKA
jgi:DNA-binding response OmpR family regulator